MDYGEEFDHPSKCPGTFCAPVKPHPSEGKYDMNPANHARLNIPIGEGDYTRDANLDNPVYRTL